MILAFLAVLLVAGVSVVKAILNKNTSSTNEVVINYNWDAPSNGAPVDHYVA